MKKLLWIRGFSRILVLFVLLGIGDTALAQKDKTVEIIDLSGKVVDKLGQPIGDVQIRNHRTGEVVSTNKDGFYTIGASRKDSLTAFLTGYRNYDWIFNDRIVNDITLDANEGSLNDVVVVAYGQQKKVSMVGAQSTVNVEDLKQPVANLSASLAGRIAGLVGVQRTGLPGSNSADVWIRGISTFNGSGNSASPLIVIDGVQGRDLNALDPEDISSFSILKDASATAVYGSQGANGVILITTKKGNTGKINLMFNYNEGIVSFTKTPKLTNAEQYMRLRNEAEDATDGYSAEYSEAYIDSTLAGNQPYLYPNVDWMKALFNKTSMNRRFNFSARGGSENAKFYTALSYYDETSLLKTDALQSYNADSRFRRYNFTSNIDMNWTKSTKFSLGIQGYIKNTNYPAAQTDISNGDSPSDGVQSIFSRVMQTNPVLYPTMYPGNYVPAVNASSDAQPDPYALATQTGYINIFESQIYSNAGITQDLGSLIKGLSAHTMFSFDTYNAHYISRSRSRSTYMIDKSDPYLEDGSLNLVTMSNGTDALSYSRTNSGNRQVYTETGLNYNRSFGDHDITGMLLYMQKSYTSAFASSFTSSIPYRNQGFVGRASYGFKNTYFAQFDFGYTGSENLNPTKQFGFFPSLGIGWILSNEKFFQPLSPVFQYFKIRYSNGIVGDGSGGNRRFGYLTLVSTSARGYTFLSDGTTSSAYSGVSISDYGVDITWAKSHKQDLGLEFKVLNNKLSFVLDYFHEHRTGVFLQRSSLPSYVGLQSNPWGNLGIIDNNGFDGTVELAPVKWGQTSWTFRGTFSYNRDKVIENDYPTQLYPYLERRGRNYLADYGYVAEGLFQSQAEINNHPDQSAIGAQRVGDIKYKDLNGDGVINSYDQTKIGNGDVPNWVYGFGWNVTYKNFYVGVFFQGTAGADRQLSGDGIIPFNNSNGPERSNLFAAAEDRWTEENHAEHPLYPRLAYGLSANANNSVTSSWWEKSIDFIRLKTFDLGYYLPTGTLKNLGLKNARFYIQGVNLLYWSSFKLWDPELNTTNGSVYPNTRSISFGIQANF